MNRKGVLVVISGFSGAGKGTLMKKLIAKYGYALSISNTTRSPRPGEVDGKDYFFVTKQEFEEKIKQNGFIEYASYCNNYYGTPKAYVENELNAGRDVILEIEAQGAAQVKKIYPESFLVFIITPDVGSLVERLKGRGTESADVIDRRLHRAEEEVDFIAGYDSIVINDDLDECVDKLHQIIQASRYATYRNKEFIEGFRDQFKDLFEEGE